MRRALVAVLLVTIVVVAGGWLFVRASLGSELVRSRLEHQIAARLGQPVRIRAAGASIIPRITLDLSDVTIGSPQAIQIGAIHVGVGLRGLLSRKVTDADVIATGGRVTLPLGFPVAGAAPSSAADSSGSGFEVTSVRVLALRDFVLAGGGRTLRLDLEGAIDGDRVEVYELLARADRTQLRARGAINSLAKMDAQFDAAAEMLDLDELIALGSAFSSDSGSARPENTTAPLYLAVKLSAAAGRFGGYAFTDLSSHIDLTGSHVALTPFTLRMLGGTFQGRLDVDRRDPTPRFRLTGNVERLDVAELLKGSGSPGGITGALSGTVALNGGGPDTQALVQGSRGTLAAAITDGTIPNLEMVRAIVLAFGKPSGAPPAGSGSAFSRLGGTFALERGTLRSTDLSMVSRDFDLAGSGSLVLPTGALDARADVILSQELTAQAGTDLRRYAQEDGRVIVPATVSGTLQEPAVSLDVAAATRRAIGNELKRRATSFLEGILKRKRD